MTNSLMIVSTKQGIGYDEAESVRMLCPIHAVIDAVAAARATVVRLLARREALQPASHLFGA